MSFQHNELNFEVTYVGHQNCSKTYFINILGVLVTITCDNIDFFMFEPYHVKFYFLWTSPP